MSNIDFGKLVKSCVDGNIFIDWIESKSDKSLVTNSDIAVSRTLENTLKTYYGYFSTFICEENDRIQNKGPDTFVIDPIDGTENFAMGLPLFGTSVAHYKLGEHQNSVLYFPALGILVTDKTVFSKPKRESRIVALSSFLSITEIQEAAQKNEHEEYRIIGCAIYNIYGVIAGIFKSYENPRVYAWDILAAINIAIRNNVNVLINGEKYNGEFLSADQKYHVVVSRS